MKMVWLRQSMGLAVKRELMKPPEAVQMDDIHLVAAFFQDVGALVVLSHVSNVKHLGAGLVIE